MSSVAALGDGVDGTDVVVDPLPVISENGRRQSLHLKEKRMYYCVKGGKKSVMMRDLFCRA